MFKLYRVEGVDRDGDRCKCYIIAEGFDDVIAKFVFQFGGNIYRIFLLACTRDCDDADRPLLLRT